ncbi:hypothetical protein FE783_32500 [Paenibacillus mesophilus]|uniref:uridine kinase family protein n=1 Tax=Paenibacillus mesophilus TaxID=2582849 RepID=UPI00110F45BF|nr:(d)CMP kinase [Paenibacillus mesophilus]TMV44382.1 hypothetical protein FE783_32500 [Paenibacillus mesophilus]
MENNHPSHNLQQVIQTIVSSINQRLIGQIGPLIVSLDGGSGAGKSTLAAEVASRLDATVIQCDDFFDATITNEEWDSFTVEQKCHRCIDWQRMRNEALLPLLAGKKAQYRPFSFSSGNGLALHMVTLQPSKIIILDEIYSSLPEMLDVVHLTILVDVLPELRRYRHNSREGTDDVDWHSRWDAVEDYYFSVLRPPTSYHLIVFNT